MKIKDLRSSIPNGYKYEQKETGWKSLEAIPHSLWDFYTLCQALQQHRQMNKARFPYLNTNLEAIQAEVEMVNATRIAAIPGTESYLVRSASPPTSFPQPPSSPATAAGVSVVSKLAAGAGVLLDWLGSGGIPVKPELAEQRAGICAGCPENGDGNLSRVFTVPLSNMIRRQLASRKDLNLSTSHDEKLGICNLCMCPLALKIHVGIKEISDHLPDPVRNALPGFCWMRTESELAA